MTREWHAFCHYRVMIEFHLILKPQPNQTRNLVAALRALSKQARLLSGCLAVEVYQTVAGPRYLCYDEIWESEAELRHMIASRHFKQLAVLMELSSVPPICEFRFISETCGLDFAEQVIGLGADEPKLEQPAAETLVIAKPEPECVPRNQPQIGQETKQ